MKKTILMAVMILMACSTFGQRAKKAATAAVRQSNETLTVSLAHDDNDAITKVTVVVMRDGDVFQYLETTEWLEAMPNNPTEVGAISRHDINFDGYPDIQVYLGQYSNLGLDFYDAWVWNPRHQSYVRVDKYHEIPCAEVNTKKKCIESTAAVSFSKSCYLRYDWKKGQLVLTKRKELSGEE